MTHLRSTQMQYISYARYTLHAKTVFLPAPFSRTAKFRLVTVYDDYDDYDDGDGDAEAHPYEAFASLASQPSPTV